MSAIGPKRTCRFALHMFAFDPKQTWPSAPHMSALRGKADILSTSQIFPGCFTRSTDDSQIAIDWLRSPAIRLPFPTAAGRRSHALMFEQAADFLAPLLGWKTARHDFSAVAPGSVRVPRTEHHHHDPDRHSFSSCGGSDFATGIATGIARMRTPAGGFTRKRISK